MKFYKLFNSTIISFLEAVGTPFYSQKSDFDSDKNSVLQNEHEQYLPESFVEFDSNLLHSLLVPSNFDQLGDDLQSRLYSGNTLTLRSLLSSTRAYLETIPFTNDLLNGLSPDLSNECVSWNGDQIQRVLHWIYIFDTFSHWSKEQSEQTLLAWIEYKMMLIWKIFVPLC